MALRRKKEESTNDKIIRLYQEGKSVSDICAEVALRNDIVTGVIQRKLGADAVPDAVIAHEKPQAAEPAPAAESADASGDAESDNLEGMSKLERYMFEKKEKRRMAEAAASTPTPIPAHEPEMFTSSAPSVSEPEPKAEEPVVSLSLSEPEPKEEIHRVSLVDDYKQNASSYNSNIPTSTSEMEGISLVPENVDESVSTVPSYTIPSAGEEYAEMDAIVPPDVTVSEISDAPILTYDPAASAEKTAEPEAPAAENASAASEPETDQASKAVDKMKAFAMSQIEANNAKIEELEKQVNSIAGDFTSRLEEANNALTLSQCNCDVIETKLSDAYNAAEQAREEHRIAIAKADDDYRRKLEAIEEEYRAATFEANNKFQEFDDANRKLLEELDNEKNAAQADLSAKKNAVTELHTKIGAEKDKLEAQISALKEENAGYQAFIK
ncbi:MAG: hypothetical protein IKP47_09955 [Ruminococcus sp.]|nr:hypothetical protein [Ruminococcus sp.]